MDPDTAPPFRYADLVRGNVSLHNFCRAGNSSSSACGAAVSPGGRSISAALPAGPGGSAVQPGAGGGSGWRSCGEAASAMAPQPSYPRRDRSGLLHGMK